MDKPDALSRKLGLTRGKATLIAVLAVVLVVVVYMQFGPSGDDYVAPQAGDYDRPIASSSNRTAAAPAASPATTGAATKTNALAAIAIDQTQWQAPVLASVIAFDPFAVPETFPKSAHLTSAGEGGEAGSEDPAAAAEQLTAAVEQLRLELEELQQRGVHVIVKQRDQYVAMIGDRTVHVGDEIGGFTVTAIEPDHVRVERKVQK